MKYTLVLFIIIASIVELSFVNPDINFSESKLIESDSTGKQLFEAHCQSCHSINALLIGPPFQRIRDDYGINWTIEFIRNSKALIQEGDLNANYSYYLNHQIIMPNYEYLTEKQITSILDYVDSFQFNPKSYFFRRIKDEYKIELIDELN